MERPRKNADGSKEARDDPRRADLLHGDITREILRAFYDVYFGLGYGFLESVYRAAMALELRNRGLHFELEAPIAVRYRREEVGHFRADILVEQRVVVELKACATVGLADRRQLLNYLRGTGLEVGLLLHFGPRASFARLVMTNGHSRA